MKWYAPGERDNARSVFFWNNNIFQIHANGMNNKKENWRNIKLYIILNAWSMFFILSNTVLIV